MSRNKISKSEFDRIKNEAYTAIAFSFGKRLMTHGNLSAIGALETVQKYSRISPEITVLIFNENDLINPETGRKDLCIERDQAYYQKFSNKTHTEATQGLKI